MKLPLAQKSGFLAAAELFKQNKNKMSGGSGGLTSTYFSLVVGIIRRRV